MRISAFISIVSVCSLIAIDVEGQKQLVVLKKENVLLRLYPGDEIVFKIRGEKHIRTSYINNLFETALLAHRDTVPFQRIERIYFRQRKFYNTVGAALVVFGAGLFIIDQVNVVLVNGQRPNLDDRVSALSLGTLAAGLPLALIRPKSRKIKYPVRLRTVEKGSAFYRPDTRMNIFSP